MQSASASTEVARSVAADLRSFERERVAPALGLRVALGVAAALALGWSGWSYAVGAAAAAGALSVGMAAVASGAGRRILAATALGMALGTFTGSATAELGWLHVPASGAWAALAGMVAAVDTRLTPVGVNSLVALIVFGRFANPPEQALKLGAVVAAGGALQVLLAALLPPPRRRNRELEAIAAAYRALSAYAAAAADGASSLAASAAVDRAAAIVDRFAADPAAHEAWDSLVDEADRIRLELLGLAGARERLARERSPQDLRVERAGAALGEAARILDRVAGGLETGRPDAGMVEISEVSTRFAPLLVDGPSGDPAAGDPGLRTAQAAVEGLSGQLRAVAGLLPAAVGAPRRSRRPTLAGTASAAGGALAATRSILRRFRANATWDGSAARHALRLAAAVVLAALVGRATGLARSYWVALTAAIVLRPDFATTFSRGVSRAAGTLLGVGVAGAVAIALPPRHAAFVALVGLFTWVAASLFRASYALFSAGITGAVVFLLAGVDPSPVSDAVDRLVATAIGAALALGLYTAWPSWARGEARTALGDVLDAHRAYMAEVLDELAGRRARHREVLDTLDRRRRLARGNAEAAVTRSLADPPPRRVDARMARGILAAVRRQVIAAHSLRTRILEGAPALTVPEVLPLADALDGALALAAARVRRHDATAPASLRPLHDSLVARLRERSLDPEQAALLEVATDEIVDATGTLVHRLWDATGA